jgi:uncharacterized membrane protein YiaA
MDNDSAQYSSTMDTALSFLISLGIAAFGVWAAATAGSLIWRVLALLAIIVGLFSLYIAVRDAKTRAA